MPQKEPNFHKIGWKQVDHDTGLLLEYLAEHQRRHKKKFAALAFISRGGGVPASIMAYALGITWMDVFNITSYHGTRQGKVTIDKGLHPDTIARVGKDGERLLVVDDLADGGATLRAVRALYPRATIVAPYVKSKKDGIKVLDAWAVQIPGSTWYAFIWSKRERDSAVKEFREKNRKKNRK